MRCPKCKTENPENARFCNECGHNLPLPSEPATKDLSFDDQLDKIKKYLPKGLAEKILSQRDKIEGERKQVTVMFCDMEGFTTLVEKLGPEKAYRIMDQVYEILIYKVHDYGGTVNEMTGDGIMALFGAPIALEDAPHRALRTALSIHREITKFNDQRKGKVTIKMRIGIHTGLVVVGTLGNDLRVEFKVVGDTVNLASRMEGLAEPGTTYVTERTFKLAEGLFRFEALGRREVKGKKEAVLAYKLLSAKEDVYRPRLGFERMIYSEMVGRDKELDKLELQVMKLINGEGSIVNIIGEAGIGKSRLIAELKKQDVVKRVTLFEGRAISMGRNLSFHPIISLLKHWAHIKEDDSEIAALGKLETAMRSVCKEDVNEILPFVATLMGMKLFGRYAERVKGIEGEALEKLILKNVKDLLKKATELTPLMIVVEDLHWADTSSIELIESLLRLTETQRVLFLNVFRPNHKETGERIIETIKEKLSGYYVEINLEPLNESMSETLVDNMLNIRGLYYGIRNKIVQRAGGNPFFIEEVVRSFIDEGAVIVKNGTFEVTDKIKKMVIPNTINDVLMARIDRLEDETRNLLKVASVIGRNFFHRVLSEVATTVEDLDDKLLQLKEIQLIRERKRMEELEYLFKHALAQEAAYESILYQKRKEIHLQVANSIERIFKERLHEFYGMLAFHYSKSEDEEKTEEYLLKAGEEALKSSASSEALNFYYEGLNLYLHKYGDTADPEKVAMLEKNIAIALYNKGQYFESVEYFDKVLIYYGEKIPKYMILIILKSLRGFLSLLISIYFPFVKWKRIPIRRDNDIIDLYFKKAQALAVTEPRRMFIESFYMMKRLTNIDLSKSVIGSYTISGVSALFSWTGISSILSKRVLNIANYTVNKKDKGSVIHYEFNRILYYYLSGDGETKKKYNDDLVNQNLRIGETFAVVIYISFHCLTKIEQGHFIEARDLVYNLSEIGNVYESDFSIVTKYCINTLLLIKYRKFGAAVIELDEGSIFISKKDYPIYLFWLYSLKVRIQIMMGSVEEAKNALQHADEIRSVIDLTPFYLNFFLVSYFLFDLFRLEESIKTGHTEEVARNKINALTSGNKAVKNSRKVAFHRIETYKLMGIYYWFINEQKKALKWWDKSIKEGESLNARLELSRTYLEVGKRLSEPQSKHKSLNGIKAKEYLEKARTMFENMELQWDSDELDLVESECKLSKSLD